MKTTKIELPDGRLLSVQGGDDAVAKLLINELGGVEQPLSVPGLSETPVTGQHSGGPVGQPGPTTSVLASNEEPLELPVMTFAE